MGIKVAEGYVEVSADTGKLDSDLAGIGGKSSGGLMSTGLKLGGALVGGLIAVDLAGKAKDWIGGAIMAGSDLNETMSKSTAIFGPQASAIESWASTASTSLGLSKAAAMGSAASFGDMFSQIGFTGDAAASMSTSVVQAAADLGSFSNLETADVAERISAAFRGEYDSLQAVIPNINAARVESEAMAATGKTTAASLTAQEKATAVMAIVTQDGARAMGDFGKTSEGFANQLKIASAQSEDLKAKVGTALQPALQGMAGVVTGTVMPALLGMADRAAPALETFFGSTLPSVLGSAGSAFAPVLSLFSTVGESLISGLAPFLPPIISILSSLGTQFLALLPAISPLGILLTGIAPVAQSVGTVLGSLATSVLSVLSGALTAILPTIATLSASLSTGIATVMPVVLSLLGSLSGLFLQLAPVISAVLAAVMPLVASLVASLVPALTSIIGAVLPVVSSLVSLIGTAIMPIVSTLLGILIPVIQALLPVITTVFGVIASIVTAAMQVVQGVIQVVTGIITGNWSMVWTGIVGIFTGVWNLIKSIVQGAIGIVGSVISAGVNLVQGVWSGAWNAIKSVVSGAVSGIVSGVGNLVSGVRGGISNVASFFTSLPGTIMGAVSGLGSLLVSTGRNLIEGLIEGVKAVAGRIKDAVLGPIKDSVSAVKSFLGIASPSRLMRDEVGLMMGEGTAIGVDRSMGGVGESLVSGISSAVSAAKNAVPSNGISAGGGSGAPVVHLHQTIEAKSDTVVTARNTAREIARYL